MGSTCLRLIILIMITCTAMLANNPATVVPQNEAEEIRVAVTVVDGKGRPISDLPRDAFTLWDGKVPQPITFFGGRALPASVAIVFDMSDSTSDHKGHAGTRTLEAIQPLADFVRQGDSRNEYFIVGFNNSVQVLLNAVQDTERAVATLANVRTSQFKGHSSFFDACYSTLGTLKASAYAKKVLIVVSDGEDTYSGIEMDDVKRLLLEDSVVVYTIYSGSLPIKIGPDGLPPRGVKYLEKMSELSGGRVFYPNGDAEFREEAGQLTSEVRGKYVIGFRPSKSVTRGRCYSFTIRLVKATNESLRVRNRDSYCLRKTP